MKSDSPWPVVAGWTKWPVSTFRRVTTPANGARMKRYSSRLLTRAASAWATCFFASVAFSSSRLIEIGVAP